MFQYQDIIRNRLSVEEVEYGLSLDTITTETDSQRLYESYSFGSDWIVRHIGIERHNDPFNRIDWYWVHSEWIRDFRDWRHWVIQIEYL